VDDPFLGTEGSPRRRAASPVRHPGAMNDVAHRGLGRGSLPGRLRLSLPAAILAAAAVILATGCGSGARSPAAAASGPGFPVTIKNCGRTLTFSAPPKRVVILQPLLAQDLIALGLQNRIVGQSGTDYVQPLPQVARVPILSPKNVTSTEVLLNAQPDLVMSDLAYRLDPGYGGASLSQLQQAGIPSYVATAGCSVTEATGSVADEFTDIANLGRIFGVESRARALNSKLKGDLASAERRVSSQPMVSAFEGTLYGTQYYPVAGEGLNALGLAGGRSIFPHVSNADASVSEEKITAANPQVIIDGIYGQVDRPKTIASLKATFPTIDAVKNSRIYFIGYVGSEEPGDAIAMVDTVRQLAAWLHPDAFRK
jgi:iron complex transport system substrate-binding protein